MHNYLDELNEQQLTAVTSEPGPLLVLAGPGSGKTRVLTHRIVYLIRERHVPPWHILAVTFTNKAAKEMSHRLEKLLEGQPRGLMMGTFHATCARILRIETANLEGYNEGFVIFDTDDQIQAIKQALNDLNLDDKKFPPAKMRNGIGTAKNELITPAEYIASNYVAEVTKRVYARYQQILVTNNAMDFDDLLLNVVGLFDRRPDVLQKYQERFQHILVDEFQDTNTAQYGLLTRLTAVRQNIFAVGDADQCFPADTLIQTPDGAKSIETLHLNDLVVAASGRGSSLVAEIRHTGSRYYNGDLVCIQTRQGHTLKATPNHILFARLGINPDVQYVYLMYRAGIGYRIGLVMGARSDGSTMQTGLQVRNNQENGDRVWILRVCNSREEAHFWEAYFAFQYGIPTTVFYVRGRRMGLSQENILELYRRVPTSERAEQILGDLGLDIRYPHYAAEAKLLRQAVNLRYFGDGRRTQTSPWNAHRVSIHSNNQSLKQKLEYAGYFLRKGKGESWRIETSRLHYDDAQALANELSRAAGDLPIVTGAFLTESANDQLTKRYQLTPASHLHPTMILAVEKDGQIIEDEIIQLTSEPYQGLVYDLEVAELHNYIAGGIVVHNSIYRWRGADYRNLTRFHEDYPGARQILLEQNYRSTQVILDVAMEVIKQNRNRVHKQLFTEREGGEHVSVREAYDENEEAEQIVGTVHDLLLRNYSPGDMAVMYRTNAQSRALEEAFIRFNIPYRLVGATAFYRRREIKDVLAYLRVVHNTADAISFDRIINTPTRGIGSKTQEQLHAWALQRGQSPTNAIIQLATDPDVQHPFNGRTANALHTFGQMLAAWHTIREEATVGELMDLILEQTHFHDHINAGAKDEDEAQDRWANVMELRNVAASSDLSLAEFLEQVALVSEVDDLEETPNRATLLTLHAAKGLEFPVVFLAGLEDGILPHSRSLDDVESLAEERRLFYVGITRAMDRLYISHAFRRLGYGGWDVSAPSRFLQNLPDDLVTGGSAKQKRQQTKAKASSWDWSSGGAKSGGNNSSSWSAPARPSRHTAVSPSTAPPEKKLPLPAHLRQESLDDEGDDRATKAARYKTGQKVRHAKFGIGTVIESKVTGNDEEVSIAFPEYGIKRLAASFANLELIE